MAKKRKSQKQKKSDNSLKIIFFMASILLIILGIILLFVYNNSSTIPTSGNSTPEYSPSKESYIWIECFKNKNKYPIDWYKPNNCNLDNNTNKNWLDSIRQVFGGGDNVCPTFEGNTVNNNWKCSVLKDGNIIYMETTDPKYDIINLHGGGWICGCANFPFFQQNYNFADSIADIYDLNYPLSPESRYDDQNKNIAESFEFICEKSKLPKIIIGGSAGGNLSSVLSLTICDPTSNLFKYRHLLAGCIHISACLASNPVEWDTFWLNSNDSINFSQDMAKFWGCHCTDIKPNYKFPTNYKYAPLKAPDNILRNQPPTLIIASPNEVLFAENKYFATIMEKNSSSMVKFISTGVGHDPIAEESTNIYANEFIYQAIEKYNPLIPSPSDDDIILGNVKITDKGIQIGNNVMLDSDGLKVGDTEVSSNLIYAAGNLSSDNAVLTNPGILDRSNFFGYADTMTMDLINLSPMSKNIIGSEQSKQLLPFSYESFITKWKNSFYMRWGDGFFMICLSDKINKASNSILMMCDNIRTANILPNQIEDPFENSPFYPITDCANAEDCGGTNDFTLSSILDSDIDTYNGQTKYLNKPIVLNENNYYSMTRNTLLTFESYPVLKPLNQLIESVVIDDRYNLPATHSTPGENRKMSIGDAWLNPTPTEIKQHGSSRVQCYWPQNAISAGEGIVIFSSVHAYSMAAMTAKIIVINDIGDMSLDENKERLAGATFPGAYGEDPIAQRFNWPTGWTNCYDENGNFRKGQTIQKTNQNSYEYNGTPNFNNLISFIRWAERVSIDQTNLFNRNYTNYDNNEYVYISGARQDPELNFENPTFHYLVRAKSKSFLFDAPDWTNTNHTNPYKIVNGEIEPYYDWCPETRFNSDQFEIYCHKENEESAWRSGIFLPESKYEYEPTPIKFLDENGVEMFSPYIVQLTAFYMSPTFGKWACFYKKPYEDKIKMFVSTTPSITGPYRLKKFVVYTIPFLQSNERWGTTSYAINVQHGLDAGSMFGQKTEAVLGYCTQFPYGPSGQKATFLGSSLMFSSGQLPQLVRLLVKTTQIENYESPFEIILE